MTWSLLVNDILRLVIFEWCDVDTALMTIFICQDWHKHLTSIAPNINTAWLSLYLKTWPFIRALNDSSARFDWRLMLLHHRLMMREIRDLWKLVHQRTKQYVIESQLSIDVQKYWPSCSAADLVAWQDSNQVLLPIDFCFSMMTCGGEDVWKDFDMPERRYGYGDHTEYKPIKSLQASRYSEFEYEMDQAQPAGPLQFVVDPKADPKFVVLRDYDCDYIKYVAMSVVDTSAQSSFQAISVNANSRRSSK
jgi:hypothetical protein